MNRVKFNNSFTLKLNQNIDQLKSKSNLVIRQ